MGAFDFVNRLAHYRVESHARERLNGRHAMLVAPFRPCIRGARVLDLGAHDGRWSYAFAAAGAAEVVGVEARAELVARFARFPDPDLRARVRLVVGEACVTTEQLAAAGERFDVVALFGLLYHLMDHYRLLRAIRALEPGLVIVDGTFLERPGPVVALVRERTDNPLNAVAALPDQQVTVKGVPSRRALEVMAETLGWTTRWLDWSRLPPERRKGLADYYRAGPTRRASCVLMPQGP